MAVRIALLLALVHCGCVVQATPRPPPPPSIDMTTLRAGWLRGTVMLSGQRLTKQSLIRVLSRDGRTSRYIRAADVRVGEPGLFFWHEEDQELIGWDWHQIGDIAVVTAYGGGTAHTHSTASSSNERSGWSESGVHDAVGSVQRVGGMIESLASGPVKVTVPAVEETFPPRLELLVSVSCEPLFDPAFD